MSAGGLEQFSCDGCGKSYRWKSELAGKRVKCKCGTTMTVPLPPQPKAVDESDDPFGDALSAMADIEQSAQVENDLPRCPSCHSEMEHGSVVCASCGYNVNTGKSKKAKKAETVGVGADGAFAVAPAAVAAAPGRAAGTPLAYAGMPTRRAVAVQNSGDNNVGEPFKDLYLPLGLFLLGIALTFIEGRYGRGLVDVTTCLFFTAFVTTINLVLSIAGILLVVKMLDLGLGPIGPAMVKIAAVATLPGAVSGMLYHQLGFSGFFIIWVINLVLIYAMFMGLLGLDFQETGICTCIIWVMRTWVGYALTFALLGAFGMSLPGGSSSSSAMNAALSGPSTTSLKSPTPPKPKMTPAQLDAVCTGILAQSKPIELHDWAKQKPPEKLNLSFYRFGDYPFERAIDGVYSMGPPSILVTRSVKKGYDWVPTQLIFMMPKSKSQREMIVDWARSYCKEFGGISMIDNGQQYLLVDFDHQLRDVDWYDNGLYQQEWQNDADMHEERRQNLLGGQ